MKNILLAFLLVAIGVGLGYSLLKPRTILTPPRIVTQYDTVKAIDTAWVTKLKHDTVYQTNIVERVTHAKPETVFVLPQTNGVSAVSVPEKYGDSTLVGGFSISRADSGYAITRWQYQYWTPGPLKSLALTPNGTPAVDFYAPPPTCDTKCKAKWGGMIWLGIELARTLLGHP